MPRLLLTAFEPFDGTPWNSALEACRWFLDRSAPPAVEFLVLPVTFGEDTALVRSALASARYDWVVHTGQAARTAVVRVESRARNARRAPGEPPQAATPIEPGGPEWLEATLPCPELVERLSGMGLPAALSRDAGTYLCNHVLYHTLRSTQGEGTRAGFLHLPALPEQVAAGSPSLARELSGLAVQEVVEDLLGRRAIR